MSLRDELIAELTAAGFRACGSVNGRAAFTDGATKVKLPPGSFVTRAQFDAVVKQATTKRKPVPDSRRRVARERKQETERAAIEAELARRDESVFGVLGDVLTGAEKHAIRRLWCDTAAERQRFAALMTEVPENNSHSGRPSAQHRS